MSRGAAASEGKPPARTTMPEWAVALLVWVASALLTLRYARRGWVPHDEGTIAHSAERVLRGELPHLDFVDVYSGGLSFLHAFAFRLLGVDLLTPRIVLFGFFLLWVPAVYWIARRFVAPWGAAAVTLLAVAWGPANYFAALPSWYNLFFATWATAALLRFLDTGARRWIVAAGVCAGFSLLAKLTGLFLLAAGLLFLVYEEQNQRPLDVPAGARQRATAYRVFVVAGLAIFVVALFRLVRAQSAPATFFHFLAPAAALAVLVLWYELRGSAQDGSADRIRRLLGLVGPFLGGAALPLVVFLVPFVLAGAVDDLVRGVFVLPALRATEASTPLPRLWRTLRAAAPFALLLVAGHRWRLRASVVLVVGAGLLTALIVARRDPLLYYRLFLSARGAVPLLVLAGSVALALRARRAGSPTLHERRVMLVLCTTALASLVQFPFAAPIYFCYVAPMAALAAVAVWSLGPARSPTLFPVTLSFYLALAVVGVNPTFIYAMGGAIQPNRYTEVLQLQRGGGIHVLPAQAADYGRLVETIRARSRGEFIYAGPDAPELYFLSGMRNPTPNLYEFFDDPVTRDARLVGAIDSLGVTVVVLNERPEFSAPVSAALRATLEGRFPLSEKIGPFTLRWRE